MSTTQLVLIDDDGSISRHLESYYNTISLIEDSYYAILQQLIVFDKNLNVDDIIFICCTEQSARNFVLYNFDEKVLLYKYEDPRILRCSATWYHIDNVLDLIARLEGNISENANF